MELLRPYLEGIGVAGSALTWTAGALAAAALLALAVAVHLGARRFVLGVLHPFAARTRTLWDEKFVEWRVFDRATHLVPPLLVHALAPLAFAGHPSLVGLVRSGAEVYLLAAGLFLLDALGNAALAIFELYPVARQVPVKGFVQVFKILVWFLGGVFLVALLLGRSPLYFVSGMGALTAVLLLIFKDTILGLVAGIQLAGNRMVAVGDWIEMPKYGADGDVIEVALTTVKVRNWDKTITTVPTYALISDSFKNWRGMQESGGRRIKRAVHIDMNTVRFCTEEMLERYARITFIAEYLERKRAELAAANAGLGPGELATVANGRRLTNLGTFRAYVAAYLRHHPMISGEMTFLVRQLAPTEHGLPLEIYVFSKDTAWARYEGIQSDIFDHILAVVPQFDLRVFQSPSGGDLRALAEGLAGRPGPAGVSAGSDAPS